jgi:hypothetical protein
VLKRLCLGNDFGFSIFQLLVREFALPEGFIYLGKFFYVKVLYPDFGKVCYSFVKTQV